MKRKKIEYNPQPNCPHCGGIHYRQWFDDCPYLKLAAAGNENARGILRANGTLTEELDGHPSADAPAKETRK